MKTLFDGFADNAQPKESGNWFEPGRYTCRLGVMKYKSAMRKTNLPGVVAECEILAAEGEGANQVGTTAAWVSKQRGSRPEEVARWYGDLLEFVGAVVGLHPRLDRELLLDKLRPRAGELLTQGCTTQAFKGALIDLHAHQITIGDGGLFTKHEWSPFRRGSGGPIVVSDAMMATGDVDLAAIRKAEDR